MEECFGTHLTNTIFSQKVCCLREMKKAIMKVDRRMMLERCVVKAPILPRWLKLFPGWAKLWDLALDLGWKAVLGLKMVSRAMSHQGREHPCYICAHNAKCH